MYLNHYKLNTFPFIGVPDPHAFYESGCRETVISDLVRSCAQSGAASVVTGAVGAGKTTLAQKIRQRIPNAWEALIVEPQLGSQKPLCEGLARTLGWPDGSPPSPVNCLDRIRQRMEDRRAIQEDYHLLLIIEEAQRLPFEAWTDLSLLFSGLKAWGVRTPHVVLMGQPELAFRVAQTHLCPIARHVNHNVRLEPLSETDTIDYLAFRIHAAGGPQNGLFSNAAACLIAQVSQGLPHRINRLAHLALCAAFQERANGVSVHHAQQAEQDSPFNTHQIRLRPTTLWTHLGQITSLPSAHPVLAASIP